MKTKLSNPVVDYGSTGANQFSMALPTTRWLARRLLVLVLSMAVLGGSAIPAQQARLRSFAVAVAGYSWNLVGWEVDALSSKAAAAVTRPAAELATPAAVEEVKAYLARASRIGEIEGEIARRASASGVNPDPDADAPTTAQLTAELAGLRVQQEAVRPQVEQVIEWQVASVLADSGFLGWSGHVWPPVSFTFVEPPKKLVVSRRDRIETIYSQMIAANMGLDAITKAEAEIGRQRNAVGYVTDIGGLGAFPTMVVDRATLRWVLSTVAHEWTHNYLVFHPLGWNYFASQDLTTLNESVAEIVGNEIGDRTLARYYPEMVPSPLPVEPPASPETTPFLFQNEMRITRLEVDRLLALDKVEEAEAYMEQRRLEFIENGYPLRVLNQAYFAFHGSYGTSPASTSPIGPKLDELRALTPDVETFLTVVQRFTSPVDLDRAIAEWQIGRTGQS